MISSYLLFLLFISGLAASAPIPHHRHHLLNSPFPYGKLADKLLRVNDASYTIDDFDEHMVRVYPENHSIPFSSAPPIDNFEPKLPVPINITPNVGTENLFSLSYRIPDIITKVVSQEWDTALVWWRAITNSLLVSTSFDLP